MAPIPDIFCSANFRLRTLGGEMNKRRTILTAAALATFFATPALAQTAYPARPVQVIIGFPAGGNVDVMARVLVGAMGEDLRQQFVVVNRDGASGAIGFGLLANATPDGYTLGGGPTTPISIAPHLMKDLKYGVDSFAYICQSFENVFTIAVPMDSPLRSVNDLMAAARASPGKLTYGHSGVGTVPHLSVANLAYRTNVEFSPIAYRGEAPMLLDLLPGRLSFGSPSVGAIVGRNLRVLAVFADRRHPAFPDAPTFAELGMPSMPPGLNGLFAPKGTPPKVLATLERACERAVKSESFRAAAERLNQPIVYLNGAEFAARALADYRYKGELITALAIKVE
jgi:tripartite-type tricarboxylate transporter receptor subunit TctC